MLRMNRKRRGILILLAAGFVPVVALALWLREPGHDFVEVLGLPTIVGLAALMVVLAAVGVGFLRSARGGPGEVAPADYRHAWRLFAAIGLLLAVAATVRALAIPETFGEQGFYRGAALADARERAPRHVGQAACAECHEEQAALHDKDVHLHVSCESCHGPGAAHVESEGEGGIRVPKGKEPCLVCHQLDQARPGAFPQIRWREHYEFVGVADESVACTACHDPHEPLFLDRDLRSARLHPLVHRCGDCHTGDIDAAQARPAEHPAIFECSYCHAGVVADFATRTHQEVRCTTCHLFVKESDFAGRIIRDADPRFCLLCHRAAPFRSADAAPPSIEWPAHLEDVGEEDATPSTPCITCHRDAIHAPPPAARASAEPGEAPGDEDDDDGE